jgi:predicted RNase H-like HicB family nuclease
MLTAYIKVAMHRDKYSILEDDGTFIGTIPGCEGVWANAEKLEACRNELQEVLEEWITLGLQMGHPLPVIDGIDLYFKKDEAA